MGIEHARCRRTKGPAKTLRFGAGRSRFKGSRRVRLVGQNSGVTSRMASPEEMAALDAQITDRRTLTPLDTVPPNLPTRKAERLTRKLSEGAAVE